MLCRCCGSRQLTPLWSDAAGHQWLRCGECGSDTSSAIYDPSIYDAAYYHTHHGGATPEYLERQLHANITWFDHHKGKGLTFLDVGSAEGSAMRLMGRMGWSVHGFDVSSEAKRICPPGHHVTVNEFFHSALFTRRFDAVLCREVVEHVPEPNQFLFSLVAVTESGGLLQVQTPKPTTEVNPIGYQKAHLQLYSPRQLRVMLERFGMDIIEPREWEHGQAVLCRKK